MDQLINALFKQYAEYNVMHIYLEAIAVIFGFISVYFSQKNKFWVFPTGMLSTSIFVYLLLAWGLLGDMMINAYYFIMSIYGWYIWTNKQNGTQLNPISKTNYQEKIKSVAIFIATLIFVYTVYKISDRWNNWVAYADCFTTAIFFVGMWLMAKRKIENWVYWLIGDLISIFLYFYKGYTLTSIQYLVFTFMAIFGYLSWKKLLNNKKQTL